MSDLISREKTLYRLATSAVYYFDLEEDQAAHGWAMHIVSGMPDEEPKVIRCKDCKWFGGIGCAIRIVDDSDKPKEDDFCSFAERKQIESKLESVEKSMLVAYEPEEIKQKSKLNAEPQTERPCENCQEWDCYGCDYKQTEREGE